MTDEGRRLGAVTDWVTIAEASHLAGVSDKTMRRRIAGNQVEHRMEGGKYLIRAESVVPSAPGRELIPMEIFNRLDALRADLTLSEVARARAEALAEHQAERAASEAERRQRAEAEVERLTVEIQQLRTVPRRWWQRK